MISRSALLATQTVTNLCFQRTAKRLWRVVTSYQRRTALLSPITLGRCPIPTKISWSRIR